MTAQDRPLVGIMFRVGSAAGLVATGICVKAAPSVPVGEAMFIRSVAAVVFILLASSWRGGLWATLHTRSYRSHLGRGLIGAVGIYFLFAAYSLLPITEVTTMLYASPFLIVAISAIILGERVGRLRWFAVFLGFAGVLVVAWPRISVLGNAGLTAAGTIGLFFAVGAVCTNVAANFAVRHMIGTERSDTIAFYFALICSIAALLTLPFGWIIPSVADLALLVAAGLAGALGHIFLGEALRNARMSIVAPFEYSSILFATIAGVVLFSEWPSLYTLVGGGIVVVSGIVVVLQQSGRREPPHDPPVDK